MSCFDVFQWLCLLSPVYLFLWLIRLMFCGVILALGAYIFGFPVYVLTREIIGAIVRKDR